MKRKAGKPEPAKKPPEPKGSPRDGVTFFRLIRAVTGIRIVKSVLRDPGITVSDLTKIVGVSQACCSQSLAALKAGDLCSSESNGRFSNYRVEKRQLEIYLDGARACFAGLTAEDGARLAVEEISAVCGLLCAGQHLRILTLLLQSGDRSVSELVAALGLTQSNVSASVTKLEHAGLVSRRKDGRSSLVCAEKEKIAQFLGALSNLENATEDESAVTARADSGVKKTERPRNAGGRTGTRPSSRRRSLIDDDDDDFGFSDDDLDDDDLDEDDEDRELDDDDDMEDSFGDDDDFGGGRGRRRSIYDDV